MNVSIANSGPQLTESELEQFEKTHGREIPIAYRKFLLKYNGGQPNLSGFRMNSGVEQDQTGSVKRFLGINMPERTLDVGYALETFRDRIPSYLFPVARDPGGNLIGIVVEGEAEGQVLFWDHEREADEGEAPTDNNLYFIADTFEKFLDDLDSE